MITERFTLTETRQLIYPAKTGSNWIYIKAEGNDCYIGGDNVTTDGNGMKIINTETLSVFVESGEEVWAISKTGVHAVILFRPVSR